MRFSNCLRNLMNVTTHCVAHFGYIITRKKEQMATEARCLQRQICVKTTTAKRRQSSGNYYKKKRCRCSDRSLYPFHTYTVQAAVLCAAPQIFLSAETRLRLSCGRSRRKVYVLIAVNTVPSLSSPYICGFLWFSAGVEPQRTAA